MERGVRIMIIYKSTNLINGKIYIGKQKTNDKNYFGGGINIKKDITKVEEQLRGNCEPYRVESADNVDDVFNFFEQCLHYHISLSGGETYNLGSERDNWLRFKKDYRKY
jgi:hypothetical protein